MNSLTYTVCFSGTACTRDEGEETRPGSDKSIYCKDTGYIPVRIHKEITGALRRTASSVIVRGVGENDWCQPRNNSEPLIFNDPLKAPKDLLHSIQTYSGGNQLSQAAQISGWAATALALHGANLAAASGAGQYNFIGHSRGAVECIMATWFLYAYGPRDIPVNIFAIDPVPGPGEWYGILTQLPPNVTHYVGVYAWDHSKPDDIGFTALVPRPNGRMIPEQHGGNGGGAFSDDLTQSCRLVKVSIRSGREVEGIQGTYVAPSGAEFTGAFHGGGGGALNEFTLASGEYITRVDGRSGVRIDQLKFTTSSGKLYGPYGGSGGAAWSIPNIQVGGFFGRSGSTLDAIGFFTPDGRMTGQSDNPKLGETWKTLADNYQLADPLKPGDSPQPQGYELYACRGRHSTVAGNTTGDGKYDPVNVSTSVAPVPKLVYKVARGYLTKWGTTFGITCAVEERAIQLRRKIHTDHAKFDAMGGGGTRTSILPGRPYVRHVSSISGSDPSKYYYFDDVVGDPPYKLAYPVTNERKDAGWVRWNFL